MSALDAIQVRGYWSAFPENQGAYGEESAASGRAAFDALLGEPFPLDQRGTSGQVGAERSPYGFDLGVPYPRSDTDALLAAMSNAMPSWRDAGREVRSAVCIEILNRLNARSAEIANAVMHTSGQGYGMAFQAGGPHAQDRGLEAVAYAFAEMTRSAAHAVWQKPQGKRPPLRMSKRYVVAPRGIALVIGCNTFPTWNAYPGIFASLATGNPVLIKPHHNAVLPLALTVSSAREVLAEVAFDPNLVCLAVGEPEEHLAATLAVRPEVKVVDYTGSSEFGDWLEDHARQARVYTEKAGVNTVVIDSTDDYQGMLSNLAFSLSLFSGQMCTTPQNILIPSTGISTDAGHKTFDDVAADLSGAITQLLADPVRATGLLGAIVNDGVSGRLGNASGLGCIVLPSNSLPQPEFAAASVVTPLVVRLTAGEREAYLEEHFRPISFLIETDSTDHSLAILRRTLREAGALTVSVYSSDESVLAAAEEVTIDGGAALSCNLTGGVYVNQSAAFSDYHATGANPAANACLTDIAFVAGRFHIVQSRRHVTEETEL